MAKKKKSNLSVILISLVLVSFLALVLVIAYQSIPDPGHGGDSVFIRINNLDKDLQTSITAGYFDNCVSGNDGDTYTGAITSGHKGEDIAINLNDQPTNLQAAINTGLLTSATSGGSTTVFVISNPGQTGNDIKINIKNLEDVYEEKTLQEAINAGYFKCTPVKIGYELNQLAGCTTSQLTCAPSLKIQNGAVLSTAWNSKLPVYSSSQGNWQPSPTFQDFYSLPQKKLNVNGNSVNQNGNYKVVYRIYGNQKVKIKTQFSGTYSTEFCSFSGDEPCVTSNSYPILFPEKTDTFEKLPSGKILIRGEEKTIPEGTSLILDSDIWYHKRCVSGGNCFVDESQTVDGKASVKITNFEDYFEVTQYIEQTIHYLDAGYAMGPFTLDSSIEPA